MTLALSTSSPQVSVALFEADRALKASFTRDAPRAASGAVIDLVHMVLADAECELRDLRLIAVDIGPGSFTGTRVAVTIAKVWADELDIPTLPVSAFDLIAVDRAVTIPNRKGEAFVRRVGAEPNLVALPLPVAATGYGEAASTLRYPDASNLADVEDWSQTVSALELLPAYLVEPSISQPKTRMGGQGSHA